MEDISTINEEAIPAEEQQIASEDKEQISIEDSLNGDASDATLDAQHEIIDTPTPEAPKSELEQLISLGLSEREADCSLRISLCEFNTAEDVDRLFEALEEGIKTLVRIK